MKRTMLFTMMTVLLFAFAAMAFTTSAVNTTAQKTEMTIVSMTTAPGHLDTTPAVATLKTDYSLTTAHTESVQQGQVTIATTSATQEQISYVTALFVGHRDAHDNLLNNNTGPGTCAINLRC